MVTVRPDSKSIADSIISGLALSLLALLIDLVDEANGANDIGRIDFVRPCIVQLLANVRLLHHARVAGQLLDELEGVDHHAQRLGALLRDCHQSDQAGLQAVLEHEGRSVAPLEVERDRPKPAHVEECLVLDTRDAIVLQVLDIHERSLLGVVRSSVRLEGTHVC